LFKSYSIYKTSVYGVFSFFFKHMTYKLTTFSDQEFARRPLASKQ